MTERNKRLDMVFAALADETRRELVRRLTQRTERDGEKTMSELSEGLPMSLAAVSKHVKVMERAGLVKRRIDGRTHYIRLAPEAMAPALDWISIYRNFWNKRFDFLEQQLTDSENQSDK